MNAVANHFRLGRFILAVALLILLCSGIARAQPMPGETNPITSGFSTTNGVWYKSGARVTPAGMSEFRVINGKAFWKSDGFYYYNSMTSQTSGSWGNAGSCTALNASCFFVENGHVYYALGSTYYYNDLSVYTASSQTWRNSGACSLSGATAFEVDGDSVFFRYNTTYYYNNLSTYVSASQTWGNDGVCTQSGAFGFVVSGGRPYWDISLTAYVNSVNSYTASPASWGSIATYSSAFPAPDTTYNPCDYPYIATPVAGAATNITTNAFTANWSSADGATGYYLDVSSNSAFANFLPGFENLNVSNVLSKSIGGLAPGTDYYYQVRAYNSAETSANSSTTSVTTVYFTPLVPVADAASCVEYNGFTANWESAKGANGYRLDVSLTNTFASFVAPYQDLDAGDALDWDVTGLSAKTAYYYRVRAYNSNGVSGDSSTVSTTTASPPPALGIVWRKPKVIFSWATNPPNFYLEYATNLSAPVWISNSGSPAIVSGQYMVTNTSTNTIRFFRLSNPPCP